MVWGFGQQSQHSLPEYRKLRGARSRFHGLGPMRGSRLAFALIVPAAAVVLWFAGRPSMRTVVTSDTPPPVSPERVSSPPAPAEAPPPVPEAAPATASPAAPALKTRS